MTVFGVSDTSSRLYLPKASSKWSLEGLVGGGGTGSNAVLYSIGMSDTESIDIRRCFNETNHIFAFGRDVSKTVMTVSVLVFIGKPCGGGSGDVTLDTLHGKYEKARVSKSKTAKMIQFDDVTAYGFLINMDVGDIDPKTSTFVARFTYILDLDK